MSSNHTIRVHNSMTEIDGDRWNALASTDNPFVSHDFLTILEQSQCVGGRSGWHPRPVTVWNDTGVMVAAAPVYLKHHSMGEYVFDQAWGDAYARAGGQYYPKLQVAVPFSPVPGPRLLAHTDHDRQALLDALIHLTESSQLSSLHVTFPNQDEWSFMGKAGLLQRTDLQYHWLNQGYKNFDDFLNGLSSRKRKVIRRERRDAVGTDKTIKILTGRDIKDHHWDAFFAFYMDTGGRKWGRPYLNRAFFSLLGEKLGDRVVLALAYRDGMIIAGALNLVGSDTLYGRYWGCTEDHPFLHFELCYYQAIDYAIAHNLHRVEAGAQGEHKLARGYEPVYTYSAHWIVDQGFRAAVARYLTQEREMVDHNQKILDQHTPFKSEL